MIAAKVTESFGESATIGSTAMVDGEGLKARGWTRALIRLFSPLVPDALEPRRYAIARIEAIEASADFKATRQLLISARTAPKSLRSSELWERVNAARAEQLRRHCDRQRAEQERQRIAEFKRRYRGYPGCFARLYAERASTVALSNAAEALFRLNRYAKHLGAPRDEIYALKNRVLELLWDEGHCYAADIARSPNRSCLECNGEGKSGGERCCFCGGTGVHGPGARYWALRYQIGGRSYSWHQPVDLAPWASKKGEAQPHAVLAEAKEVESEPRDVKRGIALLYWVLGEL